MSIYNGDPLSTWYSLHGAKWVTSEEVGYLFLFQDWFDREWIEHMNIATGARLAGYADSGGLFVDSEYMIQKSPKRRKGRRLFRLLRIRDMELALFIAKCTRHNILFEPDGEYLHVRTPREIADAPLDEILSKKAEIIEWYTTEETHATLL